jgi:hypothetical protein
MIRERFLRLLDAAEYLANHIHKAPVCGGHCRAELREIGDVICFGSTEGGWRQGSKEATEFPVE